MKKIDHQIKGDARSRKRRFWKIAFLIGGLSAALVAAACLFASYRIYAENKAVVWKFQFPKMASPRPPQRILIFAPHCDDETLGASGLIRQARQHGCEVHVVLITTGDGFRVSAAQEMKEVVVSPKDYIQYAYRRQGETRTALRLLGLAPEQITFLGYPDQGLMPMWTTDWSPQTLFRSAFTQSDHGPYNNVLTSHAAYCGASLLQDIRREISDDKPTDIFVTPPNDDHPDHAAAAVFVQTALEQIKAEGKPWAQGAQLHYYLVHHGDWPVPQGLHENEPMAP